MGKRGFALASHGQCSERIATGKLQDVPGRWITQARLLHRDKQKSWFEVVCTQGFDPLILQISPCLQVDIGVCFCAFRCRPGLTRWVAHVFADEEDLLYVVNHNPMLDVNFCEVKELLGKGSRDVALLVILPVCEHFSLALESAGSVRSLLGKDARRVSTFADLSSWLSNLSSGLFHKVILILPFTNREDMQRTQL